MKCPFCGDLENKVIDSRLGKDSKSIRRRRECLACARRFTTYERIEGGNPMLVKHDGRREPFNREKVRAGILKAIQKRPVPIEIVDGFIDTLEHRIHEANLKEIPASEVGNQVMAFLKKVDAVAYVRFASVYRQFKDLEDFERELRILSDSAE